MRFLCRIAPVLLAIAVAGCSHNSKQMTLRIVATTDVHGCIFERDLQNGNERQGSLARFASYLRRQEKEFDRVVYLDAGDNLRGSIEAYQDATAQFRRPSLPASALELLDCKASVLGADDLSLDVARLERFFNNGAFPVLGANIGFDKGGDFLPPYRMLDMDGLRVAVIGMTTQIVGYSVPSDRLLVKAFDVIESSRYWIPYLKANEKADIIIGLIHSGLEGGRMDGEVVYENTVSRLVGEVPGFNVIIYGHDHVSRCFKMADCNGDSVLLVNPGPYAMNAAAITVSAFRDYNGSLNVLTSGSVEDITNEVPDKRFMKKLASWQNEAENYADSIIGSVQNVMEADGLLWRGSSMTDWIHSVMIGYGGAQISLSAPVFAASRIDSAPLSIGDVFTICNRDYNMVSVMLRGSEVRNILEYSASLFYNTVADGSGNLLRIKTGSKGGKSVPECPLSDFVTAAGISYEIDVSKPVGSRVRILSMADGTRFDPDALYRTTIDSYLYSDSGSVVLKAADISIREMAKRLNGSSAADMRYYLLTSLSLKHEIGKQVIVPSETGWKLVPEEMVSECLASDTVFFSIMDN